MVSVDGGGADVAAPLGLCLSSTAWGGCLCRGRVPGWDVHCVARLSALSPGLDHCRSRVCRVFYLAPLLHHTTSTQIPRWPTPSPRDGRDPRRHTQRVAPLATGDTYPRPESRQIHITRLVPPGAKTPLCRRRCSSDSTIFCLIHWGLMPGQAPTPTLSRRRRIPAQPRTVCPLSSSTQQRELRSTSTLSRRS